MLFAVTSSMIWWTRRPLIAANMPRIIGGSSLGSPGFLEEVRPGFVWLCRCVPAHVYVCVCVGPSRDHRAVDVGEHLLAHVLSVDRGDHGPVRDGDDEGRAVYQDERLAPALRRRPRDSVLQPCELGCA